MTAYPPIGYEAVASKCFLVGPWPCLVSLCRETTPPTGGGARHWMTTYRIPRPRDDWADLGSVISHWLDRRLGVSVKATEDAVRAGFDLVGHDVPIADLIALVQRERERMLREGSTRPELWVTTIGQLTLLEALDGLSPLAFDAWRALTEDGADPLDMARAVRGADATTSSAVV